MWLMGFSPRRLYHIVNLWIKVTGYDYVANVFCGTNLRPLYVIY